jgi:uncharacterized protein YegJ (DUF2314 family)
MQRVLSLAFCLCIFACAEQTTLTPTATLMPQTPVGTDPDLESAIEEARATLDVFIQKIGTPYPDRTFVAVKVRFSPPDESPQDIWVDEVTYSNGVFHGSMGDDIPSLKLSMGEKVKIEKEDIVDWMIVEDGKLIGGYTIRLAVRRMSPEEKERFLKTLDYSIEE